jgi:hypothetical protein
VEVFEGGSFVEVDVDEADDTPGAESLDERSGDVTDDKTAAVATDDIEMADDADGGYPPYNVGELGDPFTLRPSQPLTGRAGSTASSESYCGVETQIGQLKSFLGLLNMTMKRSPADNMCFYWACAVTMHEFKINCGSLTEKLRSTTNFNEIPRVISQYINEKWPLNWREKKGSDAILTDRTCSGAKRIFPPGATCIVWRF